MIVGTVRIELFIPQSQSLKARRSVVNSIKERLRNLGASVAEVGDLDLWQRATLGLALVGAEAAFVDDRLAQARRIVDNEFRAQVLDWDEDTYPVE
jgi:uncharacterized protein